MNRLFRIESCIYWFEFLTGQMLFDNFGARQEQNDLNLDFTKSVLQQLSEGIEKKLMDKLDEVENVMEAKFSQLIETTIRKTVEKEMVIARNVSSHFLVKKEGNIDLTNTTRSAVDILKSVETKLNSLTEKFKNLIDRQEFADLLNRSISTIKTEQQILRQDMLSFTTYLDGKAETLLNNSDMNRLNMKEAIDGLSSLIQVQTEVEKTNETGNRGTTKDLQIFQEMLQNNLSAIVSAFESLFNMTNQTGSVCTKTMAGEFGDKEPNLEKIFIDGLNNFTIILEKTLMERESLLREVGNISVQLSPKDEVLVVGLNRSSIEMLHQILLAMRNPHHLKVTTTYKNDSNTITGSDCADILKKYPKTRGKDGVYNITVLLNKTKSVYCDMTTDNGGWTVIQRRINGSVNFYRNWKEYKNGFGYADHEYWIVSNTGNDMLHRLTSLKPQELRVDMQRFNAEKAFAKYSNFSVGDEESKYKLNVKGYNGTAGDSLNYSNDIKFSTLDQDNDNDSGNCATYWKSAGWFKSCFKTNPNGQYTGSEIKGPKYIVWHGLKTSFIALKSIQFMIRPRVLI
ncbi:angiopoietin-4-like isoform X1 [Crassostrea angulata]|uniref:angiopoietin-4-like isoform X1 n=3 Tax=Magallana angulata TaxID=2784310 RepID=UPI0022B1A784|nr:angiopoietin-4-like isoform X1 [Crassostrea angulata]